MAEGLPREILKQCGLRQLDPHLTEVVGFSAFVSIYKFCPIDNEWKKLEVEGTLFVYTRSRQPTHNILILNRLTPINFEESICGELIVQRHEPYIFYVTPNYSVYSLWFEDSGECIRVAYLLECFTRQLSAEPVEEEDWSDIADFKSLMGMSSTSRNSEGASSRTKKSGSGDGKTSGPSKKPERHRSRIAAQLGGGLSGFPSRPNKSDDEEEKGAAAAGRAPGHATEADENQPPKSVVDFFARAGFAPVNPQAGLMQGMPQMRADNSEGATFNPIVRQIVADPYHSLEHVEKQQMMASSQQSQAAKSQQSTAGGSQKPKSGKTQKSKAANTQKPKTSGAQQPKEDNTQRSKEDGAQGPKEGEKKRSKLPPPTTLLEFLRRLKITKTNPESEEALDEIPDLSTLTPRPPVPDIASLPRPFQPIPFLPGHIGPIESFDFIPEPLDAFGFRPSEMASIRSYARGDPGLFHPDPPRPAPLIPEPLVQMPLAPERPVEANPLRGASIQLSQTPEPIPLLPGSPELPPPVSPNVESPRLSPDPEPPTPLSSILMNTRRSRLPMPDLPKPDLPKPHLPKPVTLLPKLPEPLSLSVPPGMFVPINSEADEDDDDDNGQACAFAVGNRANVNDYIGEVGNAALGIGNINLNGGYGEGGIDADNIFLRAQNLGLNLDMMTKEQLLQTMYYLLQNDPGFLDKIYEAYLSSLNDKYPKM